MYHTAGAKYRQGSPFSERRKLVQMTRTPPVAMRSTEAVCCGHGVESIAGRRGQYRHSPGSVVWSDRWTGSQPSYTGSHSGPGLATFHLGP